MKKIVVLLLTVFVVVLSYGQRDKVGPGEELIPFFSKGKWGYADTNGKLIIKPKYDEVGPFFYGITRVTKGDKDFIIDIKEKNVLKSDYDKIDNIFYTHNFGFSYVLENDNKVEVVANNKTIISYQDGFDEVSAIEDSSYQDVLFIGIKKIGVTKSLTVFNKEGNRIIENIVADNVNVVSMDDISFFNRGFGSEYDSPYYADHKNGIEKVYEIKTLKSGIIEFEKYTSPENKIKSYYFFDGKKLVDFEDKVVEIKRLSDDHLVLKSYNDELNCKKPVQYGIYNMNSNKIKGFGYDFFSVIEEKKKVEENLTIDVVWNQILAGQIAKEDVSISQYRDDELRIMLNNIKKYYYLLCSESEAIVYDANFNIILEKSFSKGKLVPNELAIVINNKLIVAYEVFNTQNRGKGIINLSTDKVIAEPDYERIKYRDWQSNITLVDYDGAQKILDIESGVITDKTKNDVSDMDYYYQMLTDDFALFRKDEKYAIYSLQENKFITEYTLQNSYRKQINPIELKDETYFGVTNTDDENLVYNSRGKVVVPPTNNEITPWDFYKNGNYYFVELKKSKESPTGYIQHRFYGLDGTKFFK